MNELLRKVRVISKAFATWLTAGIVALTTIAPELPETWQGWALRAAAVLGGAVTFIRRHQPVDTWERGVLEQPPFRLDHID